MLPEFTDDLMYTLRFGTKKERAEKYHEIVKEIKKDMCHEPGSGNKRYYRHLRKELIQSYPILDNYLLRNNYRRMLKPKVTNDELSEDSQEEEDVRPKDPERPRKVTKGDPLVSFIMPDFFRNH